MLPASELYLDYYRILLSRYMYSSNPTLKRALIVALVNSTYEELDRFKKAHAYYNVVLDKTTSPEVRDLDDNVRTELVEHMSYISAHPGWKYAVLVEDELKDIVSASQEIVDVDTVLAVLESIKNIRIWMESVSKLSEMLITSEYTIADILECKMYTFDDAVRRIGGNGKIMHVPTNKTYTVKNYKIRNMDLKIKLSSTDKSWSIV